MRSSLVRKSARANARHPMQAAGVGCARDVRAWGRTEWLHSFLHWPMRLCKAGLSVIELSTKQRVHGHSSLVTTFGCSVAISATICSHCRIQSPSAMQGLEHQVSACAAQLPVEPHMRSSDRSEEALRLLEVRQAVGPNGDGAMFPQQDTHLSSRYGSAASRQAEPHPERTVRGVRPGWSPSSPERPRGVPVRRIARAPSGRRME